MAILARSGPIFRRRRRAVRTPPRCDGGITDNNGINIVGYVWFGHNRTLIHSRARRGSGGVGILAKYDFIEQYNIMCPEKAIDGVLNGGLRDRTNK